MACEIRLALETDVEAISDVIVAALRETSAKDYSQDIIDRVAESFTPAAVRRFLDSRLVFVAIEGADVVGTASLDGAVVRTVFVSPTVQKQGIGSQLMAEVERAARLKGEEMLSVPSSIGAQAFYIKLGFSVVRDNYYGDERTIIMERLLKP